MGVVVSENFAYLLDPGLRKIFMDEYNLPDSQIDKLYGMEKSSKAVEYDYEIGGLGDLEEFDGTIPYGDFSAQYRTSYTHKEWVKGMKIERKLWDDDLNVRGRNLAICEDEPKANSTDKVKMRRILCVNSQERLWRMN